MNNRRHDLFDYVQHVGPMYGVEDFAILLYSLVRMHKPQLVVELGAGSGSCSLLAARAMSENGFGKVVSVDNGAHWEKLRHRKELAEYGPDNAASYFAFMNGLAERFAVVSHVEYLDRTLPNFPEFDRPVDMIFSDYESQPAAIAALLSFYLPRMASASSIFIDGASTYLPSFLFLEKLVQDLNNSKIPYTLSRQIPANEMDAWFRLVHTRRFTLVHLTEKKDRDQNSTAWLKIEPVDHMPYPATQMR